MTSFASRLPRSSSHSLLVVLAVATLAVGCKRSDTGAQATASAKATSSAPVGVRHSCLVGSDGRRTVCRELHGDASDALLAEAKTTCDEQEGQIAASANPCPSDYVTRCVRRDLKETRYGYDRATVEKERTLCGGDEFSTR